MQVQGRLSHQILVALQELPAAPGAAANWSVFSHILCGDRFVGLWDYTGGIKEGLGPIFRITGDNLDAIRCSPQFERFKPRDI